MKPSTPFTFLFSVVLLGLASRLDAQPIGLLVEGGYFRADPTGNVQLSGLGSIPGNPASLAIDLNNDLGLSRKAVYPLGARLIRPRFRVEAEYLDMRFSSEATLTRDVVFQGVTYHASDRVASELKLRDLSGSIRYDLIPGAYGSLGIGADVDAIRYEGTITSLSRPIGGSDTRSFLFPTGTVALSLHDAERHIYLDVKAGYVSYQGSSARKGRIEAGYMVAPWAGVKAGWRTLDAKYLKRREPAPDDRVEMKLEGYYGGVFLVF